MAPKCPSENTAAVDQSSFWSSGSLHWDKHRIGWAIAGACTVVTVIISIISVFSHCRNYTSPRHQRQIIRILYMPPVYAVISFLSYRFFRDYTYYSFIEVVYEAVTLSAFLLLLIEYVADFREGDRQNLLKEKEKRRLMIPFCCFRYRPTKPYFMYAVKWSVLQYVIVRPLISLIGIICQAKGILCESEGFNAHYANVYLEAIDFVSISVALYGLLLFYGLTRTELEGKRPLAKFLCIKLIVMFTFYQSFIFSALQGRVIHATEYWTETNIADGLNALAICIEMIFFSSLMWWAYPAREYRREPGQRATGILRPLWDSINYADFAREILSSTIYLFNPKKYKAEKAQQEKEGRPPIPTFASAFNLEDSERNSRNRTHGRLSGDIPLTARYSGDRGRYEPAPVDEGRQWNEKQHVASPKMQV
ncbi:organic solute transporter Ostalpha-domain-containing protein [Crepidotus variabilis]|uniref:Organic solute transporter Ostalpha-domain-containing protein n=1 Tax=Crepidotus variabilis TaxID=179855 RepID=A0A9P6JQY9_9AGAR|nr:organic solute transporter Ostalpha-domain-containing protein [Crepidotus variabilis]